EGGKRRPRCISRGWGLLRETAVFAGAWPEARWHLEAPSTSRTEPMASRPGTQKMMAAAGVPIVPGLTRPASTAAELKEFGRKAGYPILLKAAAGGGGKGIRRFDSEQEVQAAVPRAPAEAMRLFDSAPIIGQEL